MEHAKKMVLVSAEDAGVYREPMIGGGGGPSTTTTMVAPLPSVQTPGDPVSRLDAELSSILHSRKYNGESEKWKEYLRVLQRYLFLVEARNGPIDPSLPGMPREQRERQPLSSEQPTFSYTTIIESVPKAFQRKAKALVDYLLNTPGAANSVSWDREGRVTIDGLFVPTSNIVDLVNDAVRSRKDFKAVGRDLFIRSLRSKAIPREFIGNTKLWALGEPSIGVKRKRHNSATVNEEHAYYSQDEESDVGYDGSAGGPVEPAITQSIIKSSAKKREGTVNARRGLNFAITPEKIQPGKQKKKKKKNQGPIAKRPRKAPAAGPVVIPRGFEYWLKL